MAWKTPATPCYSCGKILDASFEIGDEVVNPKPNDVTICVYCQSLLIFDDELRLREPTEAEHEQALQDHRIGEAIRNLKIFKLRLREDPDLTQ